MQLEARRSQYSTENLWLDTHPYWVALVMNFELFPATAVTPSCYAAATELCSVLAVQMCSHCMALASSPWVIYDNTEPYSQAKHCLVTVVQNYTIVFHLSLYQALLLFQKQTQHQQNRYFFTYCYRRIPGPMLLLLHYTHSFLPSFLLLIHYRFSLTHLLRALPQGCGKYSSRWMQTLRGKKKNIKVPGTNLEGAN